jgi:hypothetical protein
VGGSCAPRATAHKKIPAARATQRRGTKFAADDGLFLIAAIIGTISPQRHGKNKVIHHRGTEAVRRLFKESRNSTSLPGNGDRGVNLIPIRFSLCLRASVVNVLLLL